MSQYLTQDRQNELKIELEQLKNGGRREVAERLKHAKSLGDLSENSEYQEARDAQDRLERKIQEIEETLRGSKIIEHDSAAETIRVGSRVETERDGKKICFTIVGSSEAKPADGFISNLSPIGKALIGKKTGDAFTVETPGGKATYKVVSIT